MRACRTLPFAVAQQFPIAVVMLASTQGDVAAMLLVASSRSDSLPLPLPSYSPERRMLEQSPMTFRIIVRRSLAHGASAYA